ASDFEADLRRDPKAVVRISADIRLRDEQGARLRFERSTIETSGGAGVEDDDLMDDANSDFGFPAEEHTIPKPAFAYESEVTAVEPVRLGPTNCSALFWLFRTLKNGRPRFNPVVLGS